MDPHCNFVSPCNIAAILPTRVSMPICARKTWPARTRRGDATGKLPKTHSFTLRKAENTLEHWENCASARHVVGAGGHTEEGREGRDAEASQKSIKNHGLSCFPKVS